MFIVMLCNLIFWLIPHIVQLVGELIIVLLYKHKEET